MSVDLPHSDGVGAVSVIAVQEDGDVNVEDVAALQLPAVGDTVRRDVVH